MLFFWLDIDYTEAKLANIELGKTNNTVRLIEFYILCFMDVLKCIIKV